MLDNDLLTLALLRKTQNRKTYDGNSVVMVVDSLDSVTDPQPNYIYIVNGILYIYADDQFKVLGGKDNRPTITDKGDGIVEIAY